MKLARHGSMVNTVSSSSTTRPNAGDRHLVKFTVVSIALPRSFAVPSPCLTRPPLPPPPPSSLSLPGSSYGRNVASICEWRWPWPASCQTNLLVLRRYRPGLTREPFLLRYTSHPTLPMLSTLTLNYLINTPGIFPPIKNADDKRENDKDKDLKRVVGNALRSLKEAAKKTKQGGDEGEVRGAKNTSSSDPALTRSRAIVFRQPRSHQENAAASTRTLPSQTRSFRLTPPPAPRCPQPCQQAQFPPRCASTKHTTLRRCATCRPSRRIERP